MDIQFYPHHGSTKVNISLTEDKKEKIIEKVLKYYEEHECFIGEVLQQSDECLLDAPDVLTDILDNVLKPEVSDA